LAKSHKHSLLANAKNYKNGPKNKLPKLCKPEKQFGRDTMKPKE
jgi:hypothetical protein